MKRAIGTYILITSLTTSSWQFWHQAELGVGMRSDLRSPTQLNQSRCPQPLRTVLFLLTLFMPLPPMELHYSAKLQSPFDLRSREPHLYNHTLTKPRKVKGSSPLQWEVPSTSFTISSQKKWCPIIITICKGAKGIPTGRGSRRSGYTNKYRISLRLSDRGQAPITSGGSHQSSVTVGNRGFKYYLFLRRFKKILQRNCIRKRFPKLDTE